MLETLVKLHLRNLFFIFFGSNDFVQHRWCFVFLVFFIGFLGVFLPKNQ
jgi:hypothetical protein